MPFSSFGPCLFTLPCPTVSSYTGGPGPFSPFPPHGRSTLHAQAPAPFLLAGRIPWTIAVPRTRPCWTWPVQCFCATDLFCSEAPPPPPLPFWPFVQCWVLFGKPVPPPPPISLVTGPFSSACFLSFPTRSYNQGFTNHCSDCMRGVKFIPTLLHIPFFVYRSGQFSQSQVGTSFQPLLNPFVQPPPLPLSGQGGLFLRTRGAFGHLRHATDGPDRMASFTRESRLSPLFGVVLLTCGYIRDVFYSFSRDTTPPLLPLDL